MDKRGYFIDQSRNLESSKTVPEGVNCFELKLTYLIIHEIERFHCNLRKVRSGSRWQMLQVFMTGEPPEKARKLNSCNELITAKFWLRPGLEFVHNYFKITFVIRPAMLKFLNVFKIPSKF